MKRLPVLILVGASLLPVFAPPAFAQAAGMFGTSESETVTLRGTVKSVDTTTRKVTIITSKGDLLTLKAGDQVQNLAQVKPGDLVVAQYYESVAYVVAPPGAKIPADTLAKAEIRAAPGKLPAGGVAERITVTGLVTSIDQATHRISLVDPAGGEVRTLNVKDPDYQQMMTSIKVGDTITAVISEAVVAAIEPAK